LAKVGPAPTPSTPPQVVGCTSDPFRATRRLRLRRSSTATATMPASQQHVCRQPRHNPDPLRLAPSNWAVSANAHPSDCAGVQTYLNVQGLFKKWTGSGWNAAVRRPTPLSALHALSGTYATTNPSVGGLEAACTSGWTIRPHNEVTGWVETSASPWHRRSAGDRLEREHLGQLAHLSDTAATSRNPS